MKSDGALLSCDRGSSGAHSHSLRHGLPSPHGGWTLRLLQCALRRIACGRMGALPSVRDRGQGGVNRGVQGIL